MAGKGLWLELGVEEYGAIFHLQQTIHEARRKNKIPDTIILLEHEPCFTLGRRGGSSNILANPRLLEKWGIRVFETDRGGDVTYHGPGQLVCYPVLDLGDYGRDVHAYAGMLEELLIRVLSAFGITAVCRAEYPGVWVGSAKIGAIGISFRNWVSMHGISLNVCPDMRPFSFIVPCGISNKGVTSMKRLLEAGVDIGEVRHEMRRQLGKVFEMDLEEVTFEQMKGIVPSPLSGTLNSLPHRFRNDFVEKICR